MARKFWFLLICMLAAVGLVATACEVDGDGDADGTTSGSTDTSGSTSGTSGTSGDTSGTTVENQKFYYLKVLDQSAGEGTSNPGADIDAVRLKKASGAAHFVENVLEYTPKAGVDISAESSIEDNIKGEPTAFAAEGQDFNTADANSKCSLADNHYLGLGGPGGYVVVDFGNNDIANGDTITVYEIGNCNGNSGAAGFPDAVAVQISVGKTIDENWQTVLTFQAGPVMEGVVSGLPAIPVN